MHLAKSDIAVGFFEDWYVTLGEFESKGHWTLRLSHRPWVRWIWYGGLLMISGVLIGPMIRKKQS